MVSLQHDANDEYGINDLIMTKFIMFSFVPGQVMPIYN